MGVEGINTGNVTPRLPEAVRPGGLHQLQEGIQGQRARLSSITNGQGQNLLDMKGELQAAVKGAVQGFDGEGDIRSVVQGAIRSTLEESGFDLDAIQGALGGAGINPLQGIQGASGLAQLAQLGKGAGGADPSGFLNGPDGPFDPVQSFLELFPPGSNIDLES